MDDIPIYYNGTVHTVWEAPAPNALCTLIIISEDETYQDVSIPTRETEFTSKIPKEGTYYRYLRCLVDPNTGQNKTVSIGFFKVFLATQPEEEEIVDDKEVEEEKKEIIEELPKDRDFKVKDYTDSTKIDIPDILGEQTQSKTCNITILEDKIKEWKCNLEIKISNIEYTEGDGAFSLQISGTYLEKIKANIRIYECKRFKLVDPQTWFKCKERLIDWFKADISPIYKSDYAIFKDGIFSINRIYEKDISKNQYSLKIQIYISHKRKEWIDIVHTYIEKVEIPELKKIEKKPFSFPLDRDIGVTQWYGCTAYQCPHGGIDFGARLNTVLSIGDGTVVKVGYDKYGGECNQGGNFVMLKHTNGMYSTYFHLKEYFVKKGQNIQKNERIGISGNSGKWNCQNLGYHLHFGMRENIYSSSHINPVPYIDVDWNTIPTLGKDVYPKRLSGENPHPNF